MDDYTYRMRKPLQTNTEDSAWNDEASAVLYLLAAKMTDEWKLPGGISAQYVLIMKILNLAAPDFVMSWKREYTDTCKKLLGPHGYALYKVMEARKCQYLNETELD